MSYPYNQRKRLRHNLAPKRQEGVVIIMALFIVAIVAAMAYAMMDRLSRDTRQTTILIRNVEAENLAQGSLAWAVDVLTKNSVTKKKEVITDKVPIKSPVQQVDGFSVSSTIYDLQSRFNLNNLTDKKEQVRFINLIRMAAPNVSRESAMNIVKATVDWVTPGSVTTAYDKYYLKLPNPYRAAHRPMANASELRLVKGMTPAIYQQLQPYIVALPTVTKINIQTAPAIVIASLSDRIQLEDAKEIVAIRSERPLVDDPRVYNLEVIKSGRLLLGDVVSESQYFLVETKVSIDDDDILLYTVLDRESSNGKASLFILSQTKGGW